MKIEEIETELEMLNAVIFTLKNHYYDTRNLEAKRKRLLDLYIKELMKDETL